jgi:hypothetical protein
MPWKNRKYYSKKRFSLNSSVMDDSAEAQGNVVRAILPFKGKSSFLTPR